ncbi:MAG: hypothetical protein IJ783_05640, partial [Kiritimatiellae bacterium]|nr:hypothetical protein [Kiritimatiellia bacterium]
IALPDCPAFSPAVLDYNWKRHGAIGSAESFAIECTAAPLENVSDGALRFTGSAKFEETEDGAIDAIWRIRPETDGDFQTACVMAMFPKMQFKGGVRAGKKFVPVPDGVPPSPHLFTGRVKNLEFLGEDGSPWLAVDFPEGCDILVQDDMRWGKQRMTIRFAFVHNHAEVGREYAVHAVFRIPGKRLAVAKYEPVKTVAGPDWIPCPAPQPGTDWIEPGSALDFSAIVPHHEPAGAFGRVVAVGDRFELENRPGEEFRFCGANLCGQANLPDPADADRFAANIARLGYNTLRIHHHEVHLVSPKTRKPVGDGRGLDVDPDSWERFDALVAACVRHGIYLSTDLFTARSKAIEWRAIGIDRDGAVPFRTFKLLASFYEPAYSNLVEWAHVFLGHVNPHTGRSLAEEPALATLALINEGNLGNDNVAALRAIPGVAEAWTAWLAARGEPAPAVQAGGAGGAAPRPLPSDVYGSATDRDAGLFALFLAEREEALYERLRAVIRDEIGCRALLSNLSSWYFPVQYLLPMSRFDYTENHFYLDHPQFPVKQWRYPSAIIGENPFRSGSNIPGAAWRRIMGRPFCITEWNWAAPTPARAASGLSVGAMAALQGWSGLWRFAWSHDRAGVAAPGSLPMRYFDLHSDPVALASERATILLFLRGDMAPLPEEASAPAVWSETALRSGNTPALRLGAPIPGVSPWHQRIGLLLTPSAPVLRAAGNGGDSPVPSGGSPGGASTASPSPSSGSFQVVTPLTAGGFAESGALACGPLSFEIVAPLHRSTVEPLPENTADQTVQRFNGQTVQRNGEVPAAVWASSLDGAPLAASSRILVAHVTDARNTDSVFDTPAARTWQKQGRTPALVRRGRAQITLALSGEAQEPSPVFASDGGAARRHVTVYPLTLTGHRLAPIPSTFDPETGTLTFTADTALDPSAATLFYEIARTPAP